MKTIKEHLAVLIKRKDGLSDPKLKSAFEALVDTLLAVNYEIDNLNARRRE